MTAREYERYEHRGARFRICCERMAAVRAEIVSQRRILERYLRRHPRFQYSLEPVAAVEDAPEVAKRMAAAGAAAGVGPMAAVAGAMAQLAAEAGLAAGAREAIVEDGGDIFLVATAPVRIALHTGTPRFADRLALEIEPGDTPLSVCSSSGRMGHSLSLGNCDLATVVAGSGALADAVVTRAANLVKRVEDVDAALETVLAIPGVHGVLLVKDDRIGLAGRLPRLVRHSSDDGA